MSIFKPQFSPNDVFNPRGEYNREMYVKRPEYVDVKPYIRSFGSIVAVAGWRTLLRKAKMGLIWLLSAYWNNACQDQTLKKDAEYFVLDF